MHSISDIKLIEFPFFQSEDADLPVYQACDDVPFDIKRIFTIVAQNGCRRGFHTHIECAQLLVALKGTCKVLCDDGMQKKEVVLDSPSKGLLIPKTIWAEQEYESGSVLMVMTDHLYDQDDYIRNYDNFLVFRGIK